MKKQFDQLAPPTHQCTSYDKPLISANREMVENDPNEILENAKTKNVAFLVAGDVFGYVSILFTFALSISATL